MLRRPSPPTPDTDPQGPGETSSRSQVVQPVQPERSRSRCTRPARTGGGRQSAPRSMARIARSSSATFPRAGVYPGGSGSRAWRWQTRLVAAGEDGHGAVVGAGDQPRDRLAGLPQRLGAGLDRGLVAGPDDGHRATHGRVLVAADAAGGQLLRVVQQLGRGQRAAEQEQGRRHGQQVPALEGHSERLGQQVGGDLGVEHPPVEVGQQPLGPAVVQLPERGRVVAGGHEQLRVGHRSVTPRGTVDVVSVCTPHHPGAVRRRPAGTRTAPLEDLAAALR
jgi:hypothetical protein